MTAQLASDSSESEFYKHVSDQELQFTRITQSTLRESKSLFLRCCNSAHVQYESEVEIAEDILHEIPGVLNNQDNDEERLGNNNW